MQVRLSPDNTKKIRIAAAENETTVPKLVNELIATLDEKQASEAAERAKKNGK